MNEMLVSNHDIHVRHRWLNKNDMVIWDNRCSVHAATPDHVRQGLDSRVGVRATSIGERPYFDPLATGQREALAEGKRARGVRLS